MSPVNTNQGEYKAKVGLDMMYIAQVLVDSAAAYTADTPQYLGPAADLSLEPATSMETDYADNQPWDVLVSEGETKGSVTLPNIGLEMLALLTGRVFDTAKGLVHDNGGTPPYFAMGFRSQKSNGKNRFYWFHKCIFTMPKEEASTIKDKKESKKITLNFTAIRTTFKFTLPGAIVDSVKRTFGDEDTTNFGAGATWFAQVQTPATTAPAALTMSVASPAAAAVGVAVSAILTLTFNNALANAAIANVVLLNGTTGAVIAGVNVLDGTKKIMTVGHTAALPATTPIIMSYGVADIFGQTLSGSVRFTTV